MTSEDERRRAGNGSERGGASGHARRRSGRQRERKERVLHTRISEELAEDIRRMADELRVPVSNIVRTVLEEAFSVVERVTDDVGDLIEEVVDEAEAARERIRHRHRRRRPHSRHRRRWEAAPGEAEPGPREGAEDEAAAPEGAPEADVIGWQPLILARPHPCGDCGEPLARGEQAFAAITTAGAGGVLCGSCVGARSAS